MRKACDRTVDVSPLALPVKRVTKASSPTNASDDRSSRLVKTSIAPTVLFLSFRLVSLANVVEVEESPWSKVCLCLAFRQLSLDRFPVKFAGVYYIEVATPLVQLLI